MMQQGRLQSARHLQKRLSPLEACLLNDVPAALKHALSLLGLMRPDTRLPIVELDEAAKAEVASALSTLADEDLTEPAEAC
jgi:Dihydrodipicolinate synthetase family